MLAEYVVCEAATCYGGRVGMCRIQLLLMLLNEDQECVRAVSSALLSLAAGAGAGAGIFPAPPPPPLWQDTCSWLACILPLPISSQEW